MTKEAIAWLSSMPRGTTLLACVAMIATLGGWVWALDEEIDAQTTTIAVVSTKVDATQKTTEDTNEVVKDLDEKLDRLLILIIEVKVKQDIANGTAPKPKEKE